MSRYDTAMRTKNIPGIIDVVPPRVTAHIAAKAGVDPVRLRRVMIQQTREIMTSDVIRAFHVDIVRTRYGATPNGTPYGLIPTTTTIRIGGQDSENAPTHSP